MKTNEDVNYSVKILWMEAGLDLHFKKKKKNSLQLNDLIKQVHEKNLLSDN